MGVVLKVTHLHLGEELALKLLSPEVATTPDVTARFLREAQSAVRLRGEHVARVFDVGILPDRVPYMVMEYLRGVDLAGELDRRKLLFPGEAVDYVLQASEALAEAHANGIVHRDIKSANLFLTSRPDGTPLVKVLDFGISKVPFSTSGVMTKTDVVMGTPGYMSPEQMKASKDVDARTDIWALGIVLYECLCGRRPFEGESFSAIVLMAGTEPPPPMDPRIPPGLQGVVLRCLEKDRRSRFSSVAELAAALAPFARDQRTAAVIVDRTSLMLQRQGGGIEPAVHAGRARTATTLSGSAGAARSTSRRGRYAIAGVLSLLGSIVVLAAVIGGSRSSIVEPRSYDAGRPADDRVVARMPDTNSEVAIDAGGGAVVGEYPDRLGSDVVVDAAPAVKPTVGLDDEQNQKIGKCIELATRKDWQGLNNCAAELETLGVKDRAGEFKAKAVKEQDSEIKAKDVRQALHEKNLKAAEALLSKIGDGSVYYRSLYDEFTKLETPFVEEAKRKAQGYATAHDCQGLKQYKAQMATSSTPHAISAIATVRCEKLGSTDPGPKPPTGNGSGSGTPPTNPTQPGTAVPCETMNIEDAMRQAKNQYANGFAAAALGLMKKALACKQNTLMYRFAATYACAAHDLASAKVYFVKVPPQDQSAIEQKCQFEHIELR